MKRRHSKDQRYHKQFNSQNFQIGWGSSYIENSQHKSIALDPRKLLINTQSPFYASNTMNTRDYVLTTSTTTTSSTKRLNDSSFANAPGVWNPVSKKPTKRYENILLSSNNSGKFNDNDYSNNYISTTELPVKYVRNVQSPVEGYPKLKRLFELKEKQIDNYSCKPYGARVKTNNMLRTLNKWIYKDKLAFNVIMIGSLTENQFIYPVLSQLPLEKLCSKPGFLFIWASARKINELSKLLNSDNWSKKFRRSEELVFVPVNKNSPYYPNKDTNDDEALFENMQWHCWMCITGTVRRATDGHLIHCNVNTDLKIEDDEDFKNTTVPDHIYRVAENFSSATRRLHIIPSRSGYNNPVKPRKGWVIMSPDILLDNFDPDIYKNEIGLIGPNISQDQEIENIRPKSPIKSNANLHSYNNNNNNNGNGHNDYNSFRKNGASNIY